MPKQWKWGARWWQWNDEDGKKDNTSVFPQTLQDEWRWYGRMNEWHMIFNVWRSWRSQVQQNKEDIEEDVGAANNVQTEKEKKMRLMWMKCVNWRRKSSKYEWKTGTAQKVETLKTTSLSEWRSGWLKHEMRLIKKGMKWSMGKKMMKHVISSRVCGEETKGKHRRNWYLLTSTPYMPSVWLLYWRTSKLPCPICSEKSCKEENRNSIHGAELKQNSIHGVELEQNSIHGAELKQNSIHGAELKQRRQEARWWKMNFLLPIWKRRQYPTKK